MHTTHHQSRRADIGFAPRLILPVIIVAILIIMLTMPGAQAVRAQGTPIPTLDASGILQQAQNAAERADRASSSADSTVTVINTLFGAIQVFGILLAVLLPVAGYLYSRSISGEINHYKTEIESYKNDLATSKSELDALRDEATQQIDKIRTDVEIATATQTAQANAMMKTVMFQAENASRANALLQLAERQLDQRNLNTAKDVLEEAYSYDPNNRAVNYYLGEVYIQLGDGVRAEQYLLQAKDGAGKLYAPAEAALGLVYTRRGREAAAPDDRVDAWNKAERRYIDALKADRNVRDANGESIQASLGGLYVRQGRMTEAIERYRLASEVTPDRNYPRINLARLAYIQGDLAQAKAAFEKVVETVKNELIRNPTDYWGRGSLVTAYAGLGDVGQALIEIDTLKTQNAPVGSITALRDTLLALKNAPTPPPGVDRLIAAL